MSGGLVSMFAFIGSLLFYIAWVGVENIKDSAQTLREIKTLLELQSEKSN